MPRMACFAALAALMALSATSLLGATDALAQATVLQKPAASGDDRFAFEQVDEGILRLDGRTGEVSLCGRNETGWLCRSVPDDRKAVDAEIGRLEAENGALKRQLAEKSAEPAPPGTTGAIPQNMQKPDAPAANKSASALPAAVEGSNGLHQTVAAVDKIWRRLVELMTNLRTDLQKKT